MKQQLGRALALLAVIAAVVVAAPTGVPGSPDSAGALVGDCTPGADWGTLRADLATQVVQLVNQHRATLGLSQLAVTTPLTNSAVWKSRHMAYYRYMQHADPAPPVARGVSDRLLACGYPATTTGWGENIAYGYATASAVMQGWLNSPGHRANIEGASYRAIGVAAAASSSGTIYWTQEFGTSTTGGATPPPPPPPVYACSNGADDDGDGKVDYPADPGCGSTTDNDEYDAPAPPPPAPSYACSNGRDDDGDGKIDYPADPGCASTTDNDEYNAAPAPAPTYACSNGKDDDFDGRIDYPADTGCSGPTDNTEFRWFFG